MLEHALSITQNVDLLAAHLIPGTEGSEINHSREYRRITRRGEASQHRARSVAQEMAWTQG